MCQHHYLHGLYINVPLSLQYDAHYTPSTPSTHPYVFTGSRLSLVDAFHSDCLENPQMFSSRALILGQRLFALCLLASGIASAKLTNRTIDDHYGDSMTGLLPVYVGGWNYGPNCSQCLVRPEPADTFMASWHDTTTSPANDIVTVTLNFTGVYSVTYVLFIAQRARKGVAIWVYCVVPNEVPDAPTSMNISFELDGKPTGNFIHNPNNSELYEYNVTVYSRSELDNAQHTLKMSAVQAGETRSLLLFDWAEYT